MTESEINELAKAIVAELGGPVISSSFPAEIGQWIREAHEHGGRIYRHMIPMQGPTAIFADYRLNPDGTLILEFQDTNAFPFWHGTFRPVEP